MTKEAWQEIEELIYFFQMLYRKFEQIPCRTKAVEAPRSSFPRLSFEASFFPC